MNAPPATAHMVSHVFGELVWLFTQSSRHAALPAAELAWLLMPAIAARQFHLFRDGGRPIGAAVRASVDSEGERCLIERHRSGRPIRHRGQQARRCNVRRSGHRDIQSARVQDAAYRPAVRRAAGHFHRWRYGRPPVAASRGTGAMTQGVKIALGMMLMALPQPVWAQADGWRHDRVIAVQRAAEGGDKVAALELGQRYGAGRDGVTRDRRAALRWYRRAARDERSRTVVYSPPVGQQRYGRVISIDSALVRPGLPEAKRRLRALQGGASDRMAANTGEGVDK